MMNKIDELKKKAKAKKRKGKQALLKGLESIESLTNYIESLVIGIKQQGLDYKEALKVISKESKESLHKGNLNLSSALKELKLLLPKVQKVSINNPGALPQIDYKKLYAITDEITKNFILNQNEHFNSFTVARDREDRPTQIKTEYDDFTITTKYRRNENGKLIGATSIKVNKKS